MAFDVKMGDWSDAMLRIADVDRSLLPRTAPGGTAVGTIPGRVADGLGLPKGIVVATGGHDQAAGALGAGILEGGEAMLAFGTVVVLCPVFGSFIVSPEMVDSNLCCYGSCVPGLYVSIAFNFTGGSLLKWYRDAFAGLEKKEAEKTGRDVYDIICEKVPAAPENLLVLPHFTVTGTPHFDTESRGVIAGLTLHTRREEIVGAILSGIAYEMKLNLEVFRGNGVSIDRVRMTGGGAKGGVPVQRMADVLGVPVAVLKSSEAASLGAAMLGGSAAGIITDLREAARRIVSIDRVQEPDPVRHASYEDRFAIYRGLYGAMRDINHRLAGLEAKETI